MAKVMISIPDALLKEVDAAAKVTHRKRSEFFKESVLEYLGRVPSRRFRVPAFLQEAEERLRTLYGDRLEGIVLYGSEARGEAGADSDVDLLLLLKGPVDVGKELRKVVTALYPLQLEVGRPIHAVPADARAYRTGEYSLYRQVKHEGIEL